MSLKEENYKFRSKPSYTFRFRQLSGITSEEQAVHYERVKEIYESLFDNFTPILRQIFVDLVQAYLAKNPRQGSSVTLFVLNLVNEKYDGKLKDNVEFWDLNQLIFLWSFYEMRPVIGSGLKLIKDKNYEGPALRESTDILMDIKELRNKKAHNLSQ